MEYLNTSVNPPRLVTSKFKEGDEVWTKFTGKWTCHKIHRVATDRVSQSGVMYKIVPVMNDASFGDWYDENWFHHHPWPSPEEE